MKCECVAWVRSGGRTQNIFEYRSEGKQIKENDLQIDDR